MTDSDLDLDFELDSEGIPHNPHAEQCVIGLLLSDPDRTAELMGRLKPDDFEQPPGKPRAAIILPSITRWTNLFINCTASRSILLAILPPSLKRLAFHIFGLIGVSYYSKKCAIYPGITVRFAPDYAAISVVL